MSCHLFRYDLNALDYELWDKVNEQMDRQIAEIAPEVCQINSLCTKPLINEVLYIDGVIIIIQMINAILTWSTNSFVFLGMLSLMFCAVRGVEAGSRLSNCAVLFRIFIFSVPPIVTENREDDYNGFLHS